MTAPSAMPTWEEFMVPVLQVLSDGKVRTRREMYADVADHLGLSESQRAETLSSGQRKASNRVGWAMSALVRAEALSRPRRGACVITELGRNLLARYPGGITEKDLQRIPAFRDYVPATRTAAVPPDRNEQATLDPVEQIEQGIERLSADVAAQLLRRLRGR